MKRRAKGPPRVRYLYVARYVADWVRVYAQQPGLFTPEENGRVACYAVARLVFPGVRVGQTKRFAVVPA